MYPHIDSDKCKDCKLCEKVCPILVRDSQIRRNSYKGIYAGRLHDAKLLHESSSGGAFYAFAQWIIAEGGVVVGAAYNDRCEVFHGFAETLEDCKKFRGSKYVQSQIEGVYKRTKDILKAGRKVLFTGTPCQVAGLKLYLRKVYTNLYTMDLVCHAVPSPKIFKDFKEYAEKKIGVRISAISMRDKAVREWLEPFSYRYHADSGKSMVDPPQVVRWDCLYFSQYINRPSCHKCRFTNFDRVGDVTVADFWDYDNKRPDLRDNRGTSLVIVNTCNGEEMLNNVSEVFAVYPISEDEAIQPCLASPTIANEKRERFWTYYYSNGFEKTYNKYFRPKRIVKVKKMIKRIVKRIISIVK